MFTSSSHIKHILFNLIVIFILCNASTSKYFLLSFFTAAETCFCKRKQSTCKMRKDAWKVHKYSKLYYYLISLAKSSASYHCTSWMYYYESLEGESSLSRRKYRHASRGFSYTQTKYTWDKKIFCEKYTLTQHRSSSRVQKQTSR